MTSPLKLVEAIFRWFSWLTFCSNSKLRWNVWKWRCNGRASEQAIANGSTSVRSTRLFPRFSELLSRNHIYAWTVKDTFLKKTPVFVGASIFFQTLQEDLRCLVLLFTLNKNRKCKEEALELKTDRGNMETLQTSRDNCNQISRATGALIG